MDEDQKIFLESFQNVLEGFFKVDRETMTVFGNLNETAPNTKVLDRKRLFVQQHFLCKSSPTFCKNRLINCFR